MPPPAPPVRWPPLPAGSGGGALPAPGASPMGPPQHGPHGPPWSRPPSANHRSFPRTAPFAWGDPIPPGYEVRPRWDRRWMAAGLTLLSLGHAASTAAFSMVASADEDERGPLAPLVIPVVGPFITMASPSVEGVATFWLAVDGVAQLGGLLMLVASAEHPTSQLVLRDPVGARRYGYPPRPRTLPFRDAVEPGYRVDEVYNRRLVVAGAITFGSAYLLSALAAGTGLASDSEALHELWPLLIPVAGPFVTIETLDLELEDDGIGVAMLVFDGVAQSVGAALAVAGALSRTEILVRNDVRDGFSLTKPDVYVGPGSARLRWSY